MFLSLKDDLSDMFSFQQLSVNRQNGCWPKNIAYTFIPVHQGCVRDANKLSLSLEANQTWEDLQIVVVLG